MDTPSYVYGRAAYNEFVVHFGGNKPDGSPYLEFDSLTEIDKDAWQRAGEAGAAVWQAENPNRYVGADFGFVEDPKQDAGAIDVVNDAPAAESAETVTTPETDAGTVESAPSGEFQTQVKDDAHPSQPAEKVA